ncbi:mitochondrial fission process protein 1 [Pitangus sulphuratus]|nr:mitochondrial fission process protein 1 [Pitangus sulphuratus]
MKPGSPEMKGGKPELGVKSAAQLKCMYTNARSMGNKQEELEAIMQQESYDVVAIMETWWDDWHNWSAAVDGYILFRRDRQGRRGGGVALYLRESLDSVELEVSDNMVECLWVRIRGKANKADILMGVCYRPSDQDEEVDDLFYKQLVDVSRFPALVLMGDFKLPDVCWELNTVEKRQSRRFLECMEDNLSQLCMGTDSKRHEDVPKLRVQEKDNMKKTTNDHQGVLNNHPKGLAQNERHFKLDYFMVAVAKMATNPHFVHKIHSIDKQQIKESIFLSQLP